MSLNTTFLLLAQYNGKVVIPLEEVRRDFISHLTLEQPLRKLSLGDIALMRMELSRKSAKASICRTWRNISMRDDKQPRRNCRR
jgi:hypothetical protein